MPELTVGHWVTTVSAQLGLQVAHSQVVTDQHMDRVLRSFAYSEGSQLDGEARAGHWVIMKQQLECIFERPQTTGSQIAMLYHCICF